MTSRSGNILFIGFMINGLSMVFKDAQDFPTGAGSNNPFASADAAEATELAFDPLENPGNAQLAFPCDDLLGLSDPFAEIGEEGSSSQANNPFLAVAADDAEDPWSSSPGSG